MMVPNSDKTARAIGLLFVPIGRKAEQRSRIAGAKSTDDKVVNLVGILEDNQARIVVEADTEFFASGATVCEQPARKAASTQARATILAPNAGVRESRSSIC